MERKEKEWLNSTVWGTSLTSFLSDFGHESVTVLLPSFLASIGAPTYALGIIEGLSDGLSSFAKLFSGYYSDKLGKHKEIAILGYVATGVFPAIVAISMSWLLVLIGRLLGWIGRGIRGPPRDAILARSVQEKDLGKAFGVHRAGDTLGAIAGPALAYVLLSRIEIRNIFWLAMIPGVLAAVVFTVTVKEKNPLPLESHKGIIVSMREFSPKYRKFLSAVLLFGISDFSHTMLILFAVTMLTPSMGFVQATSAGVLLYGLRNIVYAAACYPFGALGDGLGRKKMLTFGYALAVLMFIGFIISPPSIISYGLLFCLAGAYIAAEDTLEGAVSGQMVEEQRRALGFGALATVNGIGDLISSFVVGILWSVFGFNVGFGFAAIVSAMGVFALIRTDKSNEQLIGT
ncbi:MAG: putative 3-hydroxyphenylpropionic transporter MhpT [Methanomethylovorans sp. PtaU1.Bin093]|jgi:MFS family permease|uniref:MFS transporter n=1 Tax=Methanomethylovorans sp. PtaU1.Bin093 TaxID=1811679 RepID=UPI0009C73877|nr:MFS transporter [Methanomethylovorans sp. PtaU1.Bin093]OPY21804.1 MAG: putative 3-hydroxyphenylpropionic transporter MhpT [Methanomethylovorans sp. PtaU1.Bin093]